MNTDIIPAVKMAALEDESFILKFFEEAGTKNPRKVQKLALRLLRELPDLSKLQIKLLNDIWRAKNPAKQAERFISVINDCAFLMKQFVEDGCHGMIIMADDSVFPVKLDTNSNWLRPDDPWNDEDELEIIHTIAKNWMTEREHREFIGKIVLFPMFGFSGIPRIVHLRFTEKTGDHKKIGSTDFYIREIKDHE